MKRKPQFCMQWHITDRCDQRCKHCYIFAGGEKTISEPAYPELLAILENYELCCSKMGRSPRLAITGGDPLLHPDFWKLAETVHQKGIPFGILGNPFHLDADVIGHLRRLGCSSYQLSLDGLRQKHDSLRKPGSFDATVRALRLFQGSGIAVNIMATVSEYNRTDIPSLVKLVVENGVSSFGFARYCPNPGDEALMISPTDYRDFLEQMWEEYRKYRDCGTKFALKDHLWKLLLYEKGLYRPEIPEDCKDLILDGCHCAIAHISTLSDGTVYACRRCESNVGNALTESLYDIFHGQKMNEYRKYDSFSHCGSCALKCFCRGCPAVAKCLSGSFYAKDPQCWHGSV